LSPLALQMADILGARSLVKEIEDLGHATSAGADSARLRLLQARQQLSNRILLAFWRSRVQRRRPIAKRSGRIACRKYRISGSSI